MKKGGVFGFGKDVVIYGIGSGAQMILGFILVPYLTRIFDPSNYGVIDINQTFIQLYAILFGFSLTTSVSFYYYFHESQEEQKKSISSAFLFLMIINIPIIVLLLPFSKQISMFLTGIEGNSLLIRYSLFIAFGNVLFTFMLHLLRIARQPFRYVTIYMTKFLLDLLLVIMYISFFNLGLRGYFAGLLSSIAISLFIVAIVNRKKVTFTLSKKRLYQLLKYGIPLIPAGMSLWALQLINRYFLVHYSTLHEVGLYAIGVKSTFLITFLITSIKMAWGPFAFSIMKNEYAKKTYANIFFYFLIGSSFIGFLISIFSKELIKLIATSEYQEAYIATPFLVFGSIFLGSYYLLSIGLNLTKKIKHLTTSIVIAAILNIILNFILIPPLGMKGAAIATAISYLVSAVVVTYFSQKAYKIDYQFKKTFLILLLMGIFVIIGLQFNAVAGGLGLVIVYKILLTSAYTVVLLLTLTKLQKIFLLNALKKLATKLWIRR